jgi:two-component system LytT family response regulator
MKIAIIEDSRLARQELKSLLRSFQELELIGEAENGEQAVTLIREKQPDLIFLDIHLPGMNGFDILEQLDQSPLVIFTTAYDEYAIQSFEYNTLDYLLKPINPDRLKKAVEKARLAHPIQEKPHLLNEDSQVFVKDGEQCWFVHLKEIHLFESYGNYTRIYFQNNQPLILKSLNYLESVLDPKMFFRINRQQIINLSYIKGGASWFNGKMKLELTSGEEVEVSRRQAHKIKELFSF